MVDDAAQERARQRKREHYLRNREVYLARSKARREADPARHAQYVRAYHERNRETVNQRKAAALDASPEARQRARAAAKAWRLENPEQARNLGRIKTANRRARLRLDGGRLSSDLAQRLLSAQGGKCACCAADLGESGYHIDHIIPIALGGENVDANTQLLCPPCNQQKGASHPIDFMQRKGFLL